VATRSPDHLVNIRDNRSNVTFLLPNVGAAPHNFSIDELEIDIDQAAGSQEEVVINAPAGEYEFYCNVPGHREAGMTGTLIVDSSDMPQINGGTPTLRPSPTPEPTPTARPTPVVLELVGLVRTERLAFRHIDRHLPIDEQTQPNVLWYVVREFESDALASAAIQPAQENELSFWGSLGRDVDAIAPTSARTLGDETVTVAGPLENPEYSFDDDETVAVAIVRLDRFLIVATGFGEGSIPLVELMDILEALLNQAPEQPTIDDLSPDLSDLPEGYQEF
jgi:hypothetical protein